MSHPNLSTTEVIDIARQLEALGEAFYDEAARQVQSPAARKMLLWLAAEERRHAAVFESVLRAVGGLDGEWRVDEHYLAYLTPLARGGVFPSIEDARALVSQLGSDASVIGQALAFEHASVAFFESLAPRLAPADQRVVAELVAEEQRHIDALERMATLLARTA